MTLDFHNILGDLGTQEDLVGRPPPTPLGSWRLSSSICKMGKRPASTVEECSKGEAQVPGVTFAMGYSQ